MKQKRKKSKSSDEYLVLVAIVVILMLAAVCFVALEKQRPGASGENAAPLAAQNQANANTVAQPPVVEAPIIAMPAPRSSTLQRALAGPIMLLAEGAHLKLSGAPSGTILFSDIVIKGNTVSCTNCPPTTTGSAVTYSYRWYVNGNPQGLVINNVNPGTKDTSTGFNLGDTIKLTVTATNPWGSASKTSNILTVDCLAAGGSCTSSTQCCSGLSCGSGNVCVSAITITCPSSSAIINTAYSSSASATGGSGSYTWSASGLPSGLAISSGGLVSGTPTSLETSTSSISASGGSSATKSCPITVACRSGGQNCVSDSQCCSSAPSCIVPVSCGGLGDSCTGNWDSSDCCSYQGSVAEHCVNSICDSCISRGTACSNSAQCCSGNICLGAIVGNPTVCGCLGTGFYGNAYGGCSGMACCSGKCDAGSCYDCIATGSAVSCIFNSDCCSDKCSLGACVSSWPLGHSCTYNTDCTSQLCQGGVCVSCLNNGQSCSMLGDGACCSGMCSSGTCAACRANGDVCPASASECCAGQCKPEPSGKPFTVCGVPPVCGSAGATCDFDSECCASAPYCGIDGKCSASADSSCAANQYYDTGTSSCKAVTCNGIPSCYSISNHACTYLTATTICASTSPHCNGATYYISYACNGAGSCSADANIIGCCGNTYCPSGQICNTGTHGCVACKGAGVSCSSAADCCASTPYCTDGACTATEPACTALPDGASCAKGFQCCSGGCNGGTCGSNAA